MRACVRVCVCVCVTLISSAKLCVDSAHALWALFCLRLFHFLLKLTGLLDFCLFQSTQ